MEFLWLESRRVAVPVQIRGAPRSNAAAKDSEWVRQRQRYATTQPPDVNETVLVDGEGSVMEGLSSNWFVTMDGTLHTAGEGILAGTVRDLLLKVLPTGTGLWKAKAQGGHKASCSCRDFVQLVLCAI